MERLAIIVTLDLAGVFDNIYHANDLFFVCPWYRAQLERKLGTTFPSIVRFDTTSMSILLTPIPSDPTKATHVYANSTPPY